MSGFQTLFFFCSCCWNWYLILSGIFSFLFSILFFLSFLFVCFIYIYKYNFRKINSPKYLSQMPNQVTNFLLFGTLTVLSMQTLFLDCPGFLATGVVAGISSLPSVDLIVLVTCFFDPKDRNFRKSNCFSGSFF